MSDEKRSVHTDALATLGKIINSNEKRDAIHLAVNPTKAKELLSPGDHVGVDGSKKNPVGIVDPFLTQNVLPGQWFWLIVYPRQITSLRHVWSHPAFSNPVEIDVTDSEQWLKAWAMTHDVPAYEHILEAAYKDFKLTGDDEMGITMEDWDEGALCSIGRDAHCEIPSEFWTHLEVVTGKKFKSHPTYFTCSC